MNSKVLRVALAAWGVSTLVSPAQTTTVNDSESYTGTVTYGAPSSSGDLTIGSTGNLNIDGSVLIIGGSNATAGNSANLNVQGTLVLTPGSGDASQGTALWVGVANDDPTDGLGYGDPGTGTVTSSGTVQVNDAAAASGAYAALVVGLGPGSSAAFNQTGGLVSMDAGAINIGIWGSSGTYTASGNSSLQLGGGSTLYLGEDWGDGGPGGLPGNGVLNIQDNTTVSASGDWTAWYVGSGTATAGTINQGGNTSVTVNETNGVLFFGVNAQGGDGPGGTGIYNLSSGSFTVEGSLYKFAFGEDAGTAGQFNQTGGTFTVTGNNVILGDAGTGTYTLSSGTGTFHDGITLGAQAGGSGVINLNGGELQVGGTNGIAVGAGTGAVNFNGGTLQVIDSDFSTSVGINLGLGTISTVDTNGLNATFNGNFTGLTGGLYKAGLGAMTLAGANNQIGYLGVKAGTVAQGASSGLTTYDMEVGTGAGSVANYAMSGGTITLARGGNSAPSLEIGVFGGTGTFTQTGGLVENQGGSINLGNGTYNISGGTLETDALGTETSLSDLGYEGGTSMVNLSGTGTISFSGAEAEMLLSDRNPKGGTPGNGTLNQTGGVLSFTNGAALFLTDDGQGTYNLDGGTLEVGGTGLQGNYNGSPGTYNFNLGGGTIQVTGSDLVTSVNATLTAGTTSTIDTNGHNATWSGSFNGSGGFNKNGSGTFTAQGSNPNYSGNVSVQQGAFMVKNGAAAGGQTFAMTNLSVSSGATVGGVGSITAVTLTLNGIVQVGSGANTTDTLALNNSGAATLTGADLEFFIGSGNEATNLAFGTGSVAFDGTTISLSDAINGTYMLIQNGGSSASDYSGLTYGGTDSKGNKVIKGGLTLSSAGPGSYLFVDGNGDIGAVVAPEPSTNALIVSGVVLLVTLRYWRFRRHDRR